MASRGTYIAGRKTGEDWGAFREKLIAGNEDTWKQAFSDYFYARLDSRYLLPIRVLQQDGSLRGEGFSILVIQCSIIEFLESTIQGLTYRYLRGGEKLEEHEYSKSVTIFEDFLTKRAPFAQEFTKELARDFYISIRCGLLHEARTKNGWRVLAKGRSVVAIDGTTKIVYRDNMQKALQRFVEWYREALQSDGELQAAFIRKFDSLSEGSMSR